MRLLALAVAAAALAGCAGVPEWPDYIPEKGDWGVSALRPNGDIAPEFAEFNRFDPAADGVLSSQYCARLYEQQEARILPASPGLLEYWRGRCARHWPGL